MKACSIIFLLAYACPAFARSDSTAIRTEQTFDRLTIWTIDAGNSIEHPYLTLEEALRTGTAVIHNENSQTLWIENRSDTDLFLQSGDLIKGGQQDRMIASDRILPAHDTAHDLDVYCVERGRSTQRGTEPLETFSGSRWMAPLAHTRLVARHNLTEELLTPQVGGLTAPDTEELKLFQSLGDLPQPFGYIDAAQASVWNDVVKMQSGLTSALKDSVTRNASPTSLELTLENSLLAKREHSFEHPFGDLAKDDSHVVGFVYAIDGKIIGAEQYGSHALFAAMWPKLLRSIAAAAIAKSGQAQPSTMSIPSPEAVQRFLNASGHGAARQNINARTVVEASKTDNATRFATWDEQFKNAPLHTEWIAN